MVLLPLPDTADKDHSLPLRRLPSRIHRDHHSSFHSFPAGTDHQVTVLHKSFLQNNPPDWLQIPALACSLPDSRQYKSLSRDPRYSLLKTLPDPVHNHRDFPTRPHQAHKDLHNHLEDIDLSRLPRWPHPLPENDTGRRPAAPILPPPVPIPLVLIPLVLIPLVLIPPVPIPLVLAPLVLIPPILAQVSPLIPRQIHFLSKCSHPLQILLSPYPVFPPLPLSGWLLFLHPMLHHLFPAILPAPALPQHTLPLVHFPQKWQH